MKKICNKCNENKLFIFFNKDKYVKDGYYSICKSCVSKNRLINSPSNNYPKIDIIEGEIWKKISDLETLYEVSNLGRIKSLNYNHTNKEKLIKIFSDKDGYSSVAISNLKLSKSYRLHRLIAKEFIPNPENKPQINHINGIKNDNRIENLEWCTQSENLLHSYNILKNTPGRKGKIGYLSQIGKEVFQYDLLGHFINKYGSQNHAYKLTGIKQSLISRCVSGVLDKTNGYRWYDKFQ